MSITIEDGTIVAGADSFITEAEADVWASRIGATDFVDGDAEEKEAAIKVAALHLQTRYRGRWNGAVVQADQPLPWPRSSTYDALGAARAITVIPTEVKDAQAQLAIEALRSKDGPLGIIALETNSAPVDASGRAVVESSTKIGPITESLKYAGATGPPVQPTYSLAHRLLAPLLRPAVAQVVRA